VTGAWPDCGPPLSDSWPAPDAGPLPGGFPDPSLLVEPPQGVEYHRVHDLGRPGWWRPLVGVLLLFVLFILGPVILSTPVLLWYAVQGGGDWSDRFEAALDTDPVTPFALGFLNVALACGIGYAFLVTWLMHRLRPGWVTSVLPRMRWRFFLTCLGLSVVALFAMVVVSLLLPGTPNDGTEVSGELNAFTSTTRDYLLVVLFLTPFQAAGEEYVFRGYLTQAFGGLFRSRVVAVVVPAVLFAAAHGIGQSAPIFIDRLAFGLVAGALVILTGGLEAGIAMHVLNNFLAFGLALAFGDMTEALNPSGGSWWSLPATLTQSLVYLWLATSMARRIGLRTRSEPPVLAAP